MAKGRMVWLARDGNCFLPTYAIRENKPTWDFEYGRWVPRKFIQVFCAEDFERITGYTMEPGECKRVRIRVEEQ